MACYSSLFLLLKDDQIAEISTMSTARMVSLAQMRNAQQLVPVIPYTPVVMVTA
jgi:hypothetical protein